MREETEENEVFEVVEMTNQQEYQNWVPKKKENFPIPARLDFICSPAEISLHRKVKLKSEPIKEDTTQRFDELCERFPEAFSKNS